MQTAEIAYSIAPYPGESTPLHTWAYSEHGQAISRLWADLTTGEIMNVETDDDRQGEGLATRLYETAVQQVKLFHAPPAHRTDAGERFARSVGGDTLPCTHGCCPGEED